MREEKKKQIIKISVFITSIFVIFISITYAFINMTVTGTKKQVITSGTLSLELDEDENNLQITNALPMYDEVGMIQDAFTFRLINDFSAEANYILKLEEIIVDGGLAREDVKYGLTKNGENKIDLVSNIIDNTIDEGTINGNETIEYSLRLWIKDSVTDNTKIENKSMRFKINVISNQVIQKYTEGILNGIEPVLSDNLVPVTIEDDGIVKKADITKAWYKYEKQQWANAVVLEDNTKSYTDNEVIPEENIESYFVWIPKYSYELWDLGNYTELTGIDESKVHTIPIKFGLIDTKDEVGGECTTPGVSGETGNCKVGDYMTHPAFQAFNSNGFWVGKFESGYRDASSTVAAQVNSSDSSKLIIQPNVYSWRNITVGNAFKVSYDYLREDESHMMKNTEWGAVAYLQHSSYGSRKKVRFNNNNTCLTGYASISDPTCGYGGNQACNQYGDSLGVTLPYNTDIGYIASTTGNITGIYDMSGGSDEWVMGTNSTFGSGMITNVYADFFTNLKWNKYYDMYHYNTANSFNARILGDAVGEMGPFYLLTDPDGESRRKNSWYTGHSYLIGNTPDYSWIARGLNYHYGYSAGIFSFSPGNGGIIPSVSFRVVLTPQ